MISVAASREEYALAFARESQRTYPIIDAFEQSSGFALDQRRLLEAARVLACPIKRSEPHWQHGRVLYAAAREYLSRGTEPVAILDIGSAKGFSALCLFWALREAGRDGWVTSVDVIDPQARERRNTVAEVDGLKTLAETLEPWPEAQSIAFLQSTGIDWLQAHPERVHIAFVDGKHTADVVRREGKLLTSRQQSGDLAIFDDVHIGDVSAAVTSLHHEYRLTYLQPLPNRAYAVGVRR